MVPAWSQPTYGVKDLVVYKALSGPVFRNAGCEVESVHATSHGMQNIAATVWFRNVTSDWVMFP